MRYAALLKIKVHELQKISFSNSINHFFECGKRGFAEAAHIAE